MNSGAANFGRRGHFAVFVAFLCGVIVPQSGFAVAPDFARDIQPILEKSCLSCHGPEKQKSGYRLDVRDIALRGGDSGEAAIDLLVFPVNAVVALGKRLHPPSMPLAG